ncbi:MAG: 4a-hydroxytetrahydrobiopterin dehydratase [Planctomycetes bacterium]|nr:4a-hydroxytetrahydrobiopterin dehydratase [Planctomycetota bacterium]
MEGKTNCGLLQKKCQPCQKGGTSLSAQQIAEYLPQLGQEWQVIENHHLQKTFRFKNFAEALAFTNRIGELAEQQGHHPDITLSWGKVVVDLYTHKINGLHENDFILAAQIDQL